MTGPGGRALIKAMQTSKIAKTVTDLVKRRAELSASISVIDAEIAEIDAELTGIRTALGMKTAAPDCDAGIRGTAYSPTGVVADRLVGAFAKRPAGLTNTELRVLLKGNNIDAALASGLVGRLGKVFVPGPALRANQPKTDADPRYTGTKARQLGEAFKDHEFLRYRDLEPILKNPTVYAKPEGLIVKVGPGRFALSDKVKAANGVV